MELQIVVFILTLISVKSQVYNGCEYTQLYRHPANCHLYLQCSMGYEYIMNCNEDLVFNEKMQYCDWDYNVPECYEEGGTTTSIMTTTKSNCVEVCTIFKYKPNSTLKCVFNFRFVTRLWILSPQLH